MTLFFIILPALVIFLIGFIAQKLIGFDIKSISAMSLYILSPCLAFRTFFTNAITLDYVYMMLAALLLSASLLVITYIVAKITKANQSESSALVLSSVFMNSGNYGAPVVLFALGSAGFDYAVIIMVLHSLLMNTLGIFFAALGGQEGSGHKQAMQSVVRMPVLYAAILGMLCHWLGLELSAPFQDALDLVANATIPVIMLVLGMQLAVISRKRVTYRFVVGASIIRMIASPIIAALILSFLPLNDLAKTVFIIQAAMPAAANTTMLALKYDTEPDLVSFTTLVTTAISIVSLPIVLYLTI
ncbi:AEC family transporter [Metasolibacillus sp.]|uniref:AEC family transporter n=1 Tax=Metasolibacillus sp. TaxID=2703680 RepID=UPI0025F88675|nr:AEC family transporter [Metasolibacillus sp.]MCT6924761.1 AEC family transporter [Metasolibacillus sp.]MCT6940886.1 AEC family transporter [Metasolibacillus sp.]